MLLFVVVVSVEFVFGLRGLSSLRLWKFVESGFRIALYCVPTVQVTLGIPEWLEIACSAFLCGFREVLLLYGLLDLQVRWR